MILVTGGAGYIGSHVVKILRKNNFDVVVMDDLSTGHEQFIEGVTFFRGDVSSLTDVEKCMKRYNIELVIHLSGYATINQFISKDHYDRHNVESVKNLLFFTNKLIFSSSAAVYGNANKEYIDESTQCDPTSNYGESKLRAEQIIKYGPFSPTNYCIFRYFNACSADPDGDLYELHSPETHLIPNALFSAINQTQFYLNGNDYDTPDGTCIRDYVHVWDIARAHLKAIDLIISGQSATVNLGSGRGYSNTEILQTVNTVTHKMVNTTIGKRRPGDPSRLIASISKAKKILGWVPERSDIETIVKDAFMAYYKNEVFKV